MELTTIAELTTSYVQILRMLCKRMGQKAYNPTL